MSRKNPGFVLVLDNTAPLPAFPRLAKKKPVIHSHRFMSFFRAMLASLALVFLAFACQPASAATVHKYWSPAACKDMVFDFEIEYDTSGNLVSIAYTVTTPYTRVSPELPLHIAPDTPHPVMWEVAPEPDWQTDSPGKPVRIITGSIYISQIGAGNLALNLDIDYYCTPEFVISKLRHFKGVAFAFPEKL